ncbi:ferredoxin [Catenuloplanes atrovinosus]|uniref:NADH:ubiquinone oxidoreductase subunit F (NADH-binding)/ferredoxin n=1 Tax=Catenuloplanes atrovinosus TaxID=137266 RepID=A0AAE3YJ87_9ACTN|nr:ferredoxin [Catenuloplanes atrovinosus]MDR7274505.1 NADH:ubiquinone oxidoreductase subunit F (NADH-binding)/ferredoxin [Catenuloplanes atrovinosus]
MSTGVVPPVGCIGPARLTAGFEDFGRLDLWAHLEVHGDLRPLSADDLIDLAEKIKLTGRGGAGFPFHRKVKAVVESADRQDRAPVVVVNATEGEPPSWKDKMLLTRAPHLILDGAALTAWALEAEEIVIGVADDGVGQSSLEEALAERRMPAPTRIVTVPHRFIAGEGGALVRGINGEAHIPPGIKQRSSESGVNGQPTLLSNAETYAQIAVAARLGPAEYTAVGTKKEPGTVLLTVGGAAAQHMVLECPTGVPLREVLDICGATEGPGILVGGYHGKWITWENAQQAEISREGFAAVGGTLGAGMIIPLGNDTCPLGEASRIVRYLAGESAGQCGPCRLGLPDVANQFQLLTASGSAAAEQAVRNAAGMVRGRGACSHPDGTSRFAITALEVFAEDIKRHRLGEGCGKPVKKLLPIPNELPGGPSIGKLKLDWARCDGHGLCAEVFPELIKLDGNGYPTFPDAPVPIWLEQNARKAILVCPALALHLDKGGSERGGDRGGKQKPAPRRR